MSRDSVFTTAHVAFVRQGPSVIAASRDASNRPAVCRACGCEIDADGRLLVFVNERRARRLLDAVASSGELAVVFSAPKTHETIQVKGGGATVIPVADEFVPALRRHASRFSRRLGELGYSPSMSRTLLRYRRDGIRAIAMTPHAIFDQTPGPHAGEPLRDA